MPQFPGVLSEALRSCRGRHSGTGLRRAPTGLNDERFSLDGARSRGVFAILTNVYARSFVERPRLEAQPLTYRERRLDCSAPVGSRASGVPAIDLVGVPTPPRSVLAHLHDRRRGGAEVHITARGDTLPCSHTRNPRRIVPMSKIRPLHDRVIVKRVKEEEKSKGGHHHPRHGQGEADRGRGRRRRQRQGPGGRQASARST